MSKPKNSRWSAPGIIMQLGPKLPKFRSIIKWPRPKPKAKPYIRRPRRDGYPDESGKRAK